ncbi:AbrB/MazE/SpoVT family DNA-binding domain-containing protein [Salicibibacter cibarius]|uniref:AbrB/MazE/SpoVT family DNA-binding domain-containing protein n=2 Tax=Salicibibacter cibarius TaxID=2743000 RepID=A0A7T6Z7H9_9BACI|nr:AbrB/MazE/SpoVT family DNA-binding domain-containing protein [Salicibibacter cibarius]
MSSKIQRWGNSLGVRIPHKLAKNVSIYDGSEVEMIEEQNGILIRPIDAAPTLDELLSQVTDENKPDFIDWGQPEGKEVW